MSIIAKVFSIVVLVLSVILISMVLSIVGEQTYWKPKFYAEKAQNIELKDRYIREVSSWRALSGYYEHQKNLVDAELKKSKSDNSQLGNELVERETALAVEYQKNFRVLAQLMETVREISRMNRVLKQRQDVIMLQQHALQVARQNEAMIAQDLADVKRRNNQLIRDNAELSRRITLLETQTADLQLSLDKYRVIMPEIEVGVLPPISGRVVDVNAETTFVTIDRGDQHGVKIGYTFWIARGGKLIGRVRVKNVKETLCGAEIMPEYSKGVMRKNDSAFTVPERAE